MEVVKKKDLIIEKRQKGESIKDISRDLGLNISHVYKVLKRANIPCNNKMDGRKNTISPFHQILGKFLKRERILNFEEVPGVFSKSINLSTQRLRAIESGKYDATLTDLIKILGAMNIKFAVLDDLLENVKE